MTGYRGNVQGGSPPKSHEPKRVRDSYPPRYKASNARSPIQAIKDRLTPSHVEALCRAWLPKGKRQGNWWVCACPWREDRNPSFGVSLTTGYWKDFASGEGGDVLDLSMRLFGDSIEETIDGFAEMLGIKNA